MFGMPGIFTIFRIAVVCLLFSIVAQEATGSEIFGAVFGGTFYIVSIVLLVRRNSKRIREEDHKNRSAYRD